jgi:hypothetical protein
LPHFSIGDAHPTLTTNLYKELQKKCPTVLSHNSGHASSTEHPRLLSISQTSLRICLFRLGVTRTGAGHKGHRNLGEVMQSVWGTLLISQTIMENLIS